MGFFAQVRLLTVVVLSSAVCGCGILPASAPTSLELQVDSSQSFDYVSVKIDPKAIALLKRQATGFEASFHIGRYTASQRLFAGDTISITIYETGGSSLFPPPASLPGASVIGQPGQISPGVSTIPPQTIERDGTVRLPYVGQVEIAGKTPSEAALILEKALEGKAVSPQVVITIVSGLSNTATVSGEVFGSRRVPLSLRGERLLDVIGTAGGAKNAPYETTVRIIRGRQTASVSLQTVLDNPSENIRIRPDDQIYLIYEPRSYAVMGASLRTSRYMFETGRVNLAEAIARGGGPIDSVGDPGGIYVFRFEPTTLAKDLSPEHPFASLDSAPQQVPVLYHLDLRSAQGYFLAQSFDIRDKDVILIANAEGTQLQKFLAIARGLTGGAIDIEQIRLLRQ